MAIKPNKENIITDILIELERGISYTDCLVLNGSKWFLPKTTFTRYWKTANECHLLNQEEKRLQIASMSMEAEKERVKSAILTKDQSLQLLSGCLLYTSPSPRDRTRSRMPSSA